MNLHIPDEFNPVPTEDKVVIHNIDSDVPEGLPEPSLWRVLLMPVGLKRRSRGGIIMPDDSVDAHLWMHMLFKVCALGPLAYEGPAWEGYKIPEEHRAKVGELWLADPKQPRRFAYKGWNFIICNDDQLLCRVDPAYTEDLKFFGANLSAMI